jgi:hypothetical protein
MGRKKCLVCGGKVAFRILHSKKLNLMPVRSLKLGEVKHIARSSALPIKKLIYVQDSHG